MGKFVLPVSGTRGAVAVCWRPGCSADGAAGGWGLPSRQADELLFGGAPPWSADRYHTAAALQVRQERSGGADTDLDPLTQRDRIVDLTATAAARAEILRRYRLFSRQPDEMITFMALQRMRPRQFDFDPRLYQYGGAFIYLVGTAIGASATLGITHLSSDPALYLEQPEEFARFYLAARLVTLAFGALLLVAVGLATLGRELALGGTLLCV